LTLEERATLSSDHASLYGEAIEALRRLAAREGKDRTMEIEAVTREIRRRMGGHSEGNLKIDKPPEF
jgi:hypothetical protein